MTKLFRSIESIVPKLTIENLTYGIGQRKGFHYVYLKRRGKQWLARYGPFEFQYKAEQRITEIKEEYDAVRRAKENRPRS